MSLQNIAVDEKAQDRPKRVLTEEQKANNQARKKRWYHANKERLLERNRLYRLVNKEKIRAYNKQWYEANDENMQEYRRQYFQTNKDKVRARLKVRQKAAGTKLCECGCGEEIPVLTTHGTPARFRYGHNGRGKRNQD
jgi:hypothetical protein